MTVDAIDLADIVVAVVIVTGLCEAIAVFTSVLVVILFWDLVAENVIPGVVDCVVGAMISADGCSDISKNCVV